MEYPGKEGIPTDPQEQYLIGVDYYFGNSVRQSYEKAFVWFHMSAIQGYAPAQYMLGKMFEYGQGVNRSYPKALCYFGQAVQHDVTQAKYELGLMHQAGRIGFTLMGGKRS